MKWVTRKSIRVNRMATAWLIRRFIDPQAVFLFVEPDGVAEVQQREGARGFDAPGATYPHKEDAVLREIARIVRGADFLEKVTLTPESAGLRAISHGFPLVAKDDYEIMEKAAFLYDSLYAALQKQRTETSQPNEAL